MNKIEPANERSSGRSTTAQPQGDSEELSPAWIARHNKIVIDTGSFFSDGAFCALIERLLPELKNSQKRVLVLDNTIRVIQKGLDEASEEDKLKYQRATRILTALEAAQAWVRLSDPQGGDSLLLPQSLTLISDLVLTYQFEQAFCIVTQIEALAARLLDNSESKAIKRVKKVTVAFLEDGKFVNWVPWIKRRRGETGFGPDVVERFAKHFRIVIDTCSLMLIHPKSNDATGLLFVKEKLLPELLKYNAKMIVPKRVLNELQQKVTQSDSATIATEVLNTLSSKEMANSVLVASDEDELFCRDPNFADPILVKVQRFQAFHNICLVTQDKELAKLLLKNRDAGSEKDYQVVFIRINGCSIGNWEKKLLDEKKKEEQRDLDKSERPRP
jgi:rRNA-processing protein FCF1